MLLLLASLTVTFITPVAAEDVESASEMATELLARADRIRFPAEDFQVEIGITTTTPGDDEPEVRAYRVLSKGNNQTLVQTTEPAIDRDQILLMRDHDLWVFLPNLSQPIRLPLSQRLTGQVANGDLARANFVGDYIPRLVRTENVGGVSHHVLELKAVDTWVTYNKVLYWINSANSRPNKAEFYTLSGRLLKVCHYQKFKQMGGALRPTQLIIDDALRPGNRSVLDYSNMILRTLPDKFFTKDYLKKLSR